MPRTAKSPVEIGEVLAGNYRVERVLGAGACGVVVAARHCDLHELRAIKFMLPQALENDTAVQRFLREARAVVRLKSQHVAKVHDVGRLDGGEPYIVMEHLEGQDLRALQKERGRLPVDEAVLYIVQAAEAVEEAHAAGIVHRDLKPANLFLTTGVRGAPCIKVLDFGIAKVTGEAAGEGGELTLTTGLLGTPNYMSPEQMRARRKVDARSDIWALGVILFRLVTGKLPFIGSDMTEMCASVMLEPPLPMSESIADLPDGFEAVVLKCLEKEADKRFQNVGELVAALSPFAGARLPSIPGPAAAAPEPSPPREVSEPPREVSEPPPETPSQPAEPPGTEVTAGTQGSGTAPPWTQPAPVAPPPARPRNVLVVPRAAGQPGVVLELKVRRRGKRETPKAAMAAALRQIRERDYAAELRACGAEPIHELGVVFDGKRVRVEASPPRA